MTFSRLRFTAASLSLVALALATIATACSDDDDAAPAPSAAGTPGVAGASAEDGGRKSDGASGAGSEDAGSPAGGTAGSPSDAAGAGGLPSVAGAGGASAVDATWVDGAVIATSTTISGSEHVTIEPGATISFAKGVTVTVEGTLTGELGATLTGDGWGGVVVAKGGVLALDGADIENADAAISVRAGNASASFANGTISGSMAPFNVAKGGQLTTDHAVVTGTTGPSTIKGTFVGSYLSYDAHTAVTGLSISDATADVQLDDCRLFGQPGDLIAVSAAASLHIAHCDLTEAHTLILFSNVTSFDISYSDLHGAVFGIMLFATADTGSRVISYSNFFENSALGFDQENATGAVDIQSCYFDDDLHLVGQTVSNSSPAAVPLENTGPRP